MTHYTTLDPRCVPEASAGLKYHKFHAYDGAPAQSSFVDTDSAAPFLEAVRKSCSGSAICAAYQRFHGRFAAGVNALGDSRTLTATMAWRTVVGWSSNPALESGIALHPILGFPYAPGAGVKGLVHALAESELTEGDEALPVAPDQLPEEPPAVLLSAIDRAQEIRYLFGSLTVASLAVSGNAPSAQERFQSWSALLPSDGLPEAWQEVAENLVRLSNNESTGGRLRFFDAVPPTTVFENNRSPLETDVLTVHYPEYYKGTATVPTDDSNPVPVKFLVMRAGSELEFRFRYARFAHRPGDPDSVDGEWASYSGPDVKVILTRVGTWLERALTERGIGAKTAAGYGYARAEESAVGDAMRVDPTALADLIDKALVANDADQSAALAAGIWKNKDALAVIDGWRLRQKLKVKKRIAWFDEQLKPSATSVAGRDIHSVAVQQVAPAMIGGPDPQSCDLALRPPSMRGQLRFWTRALAGERMREAEAALWGSTDIGQRVSFISASRVEPAEEFAAGFALPLPMIPPGGQHTLRFRVGESISSHADNSAALGAVLWTWLHLGAVGRRARRGYGALQWQCKKNDLVDQWLRADASSALCSSNDLENYLREGLGQALSTFGSTNLDAPRRPSTYFRLASRDQVFVGRELSLDYEKNSIEDRRILQDLIKGVRHEQGNPEKQRSSLTAEARQLGYIVEGSDKRLASPMLWRVIRLESGRYVTVMTWSPHIHSGDQADDGVTSLRAGSRMHQHLTDKVNGLGFDLSLAGSPLTTPDS